MLPLSKRCPYSCNLQDCKGVFITYPVDLQVSLTHQAYLQKPSSHLLYKLLGSYLHPLFSLPQWGNHYRRILNSLNIFPSWPNPDLRFSVTKQTPQKSQLHIGKHSNYNKNVESEPILNGSQDHLLQLLHSNADSIFRNNHLKNHSLAESPWHLQGA